MRNSVPAIRRFAVVGASLGVGLAIAACGSSSSTARATGTPTVTVTQTDSTPSPTSSGSAAVTSCTTANLTMALGNGDGATGHTYLPLTLTNSGGTTCTLNGYPGVSFVAGSDRHQVGSPAQRDATTPVVTITLQPGAKASTTIGVAQAGNYDASTCNPTATTGFRVYPPNETNPTFVAYPSTGCAGTGVTILTVTPLVVAG